MSQINSIGSASASIATARNSSLSQHTSSQYIVRKGDNLSGIASRFGISLAALERANPDIAKQRFIFSGEKLTIPSNNNSSHVINRGDTLSGIAAKNNTSVDALMKANPQIRNENQIYPGQKIKISNGNAQGVSRVQEAQVPAANMPTNTAPIANGGSTTAGQINLKVFFDPSKGSKSPAAIIIGNAEGNRTPSGGFRDGYKGHIDPGNGKGNRGSFSYQHGTKSMTPEKADMAQLAKLSKLIPAYETAARKAGLDPNNATLATAYFDLFNQSESAAGRFINQIGYLKTAGISNQSVTDLRFRSFINPESGQRWTPGTASGFQKIANEKYGKASEAQFQSVIRADQGRRQNAMVDAMKAQGFVSLAIQPSNSLPAQPQKPAIVGFQTTKAGILSKWPVSNPKFNVADKKDEGDGHFGTHRKRGNHGGIDLVGKVGDPIFAAGAGQVVRVEPPYSDTFGYQLAIDHGNGIFTQYAHLHKGSLKVRVGDTVSAGQNIAAMGRSGNTPIKGDTHLHFEVRIGSPKPRVQGGKTVDPLKYLGQLN